MYNITPVKTFKPRVRLELGNKYNFGEMSCCHNPKLITDASNASGHMILLIRIDKFKYLLFLMSVGLVSSVFSVYL